MHETISVIIPAESDSADLKILKYLDKVEYPKDKIEIIIAVGKNPSLQRNEAVKIAKGDILYFFNRDAQAEPDIFRKAVDIINSGVKIAGAGGPDLTPHDNNYIQHLFGYAMSSYFAHWKMRARYCPAGRQRVSDEKELLLSNMAIRKDVFLKLSCFNEKLYPNEENELINRIYKAGYEFIYSPELKIYRDRRKTLSAFIKQFYRYGGGRMEQIFIEGVPKNPQFFIPIFLLAYFLTALFRNDFWIKFGLLFLYGFFSLIDAFYVSIKNKKNLVFVLPALYFTMHMSYAIGMFLAIFKKVTLSNFSIEKDVKIIRLKEMAVLKI